MGNIVEEDKILSRIVNCEMIFWEGNEFSKLVTKHFSITVVYIYL